ncbi:MAG: 50S ribosomal protein L30e [Candidatus Hodarchaeota archaeon]
MDAETAIRLAVKSGKTIFGAQRTLHTLRTSSPRVVILAANAPSAIREEINTLAKANEVPIHNYRSNSWDLGQVCGRPHMVAAMVVLDPGDADIAALIGAGKK